MQKVISAVILLSITSVLLSSFIELPKAGWICPVCRCTENYENECVQCGYKQND